jgi:hypothetical protein
VKSRLFPNQLASPKEARSGRTRGGTAAGVKCPKLPPWRALSSGFFPVDYISFGSRAYDEPQAKHFPANHVGVLLIVERRRRLSTVGSTMSGGRFRWFALPLKAYMWSENGAVPHGTAEGPSISKGPNCTSCSRGKSMALKHERCLLTFASPASVLIESPMHLNHG